MSIEFVVATRTIPARQLGNDHLDLRISWAVPEPSALIELEVPDGDLDWISHTHGAVVVGVTFREPAPDDAPAHQVTLIDGQNWLITSDDYWLAPDTPVTLTR